MPPPRRIILLLEILGLFALGILGSLIAGRIDKTLAPSGMSLFLTSVIVVVILIGVIYYRDGGQIVIPTPGFLRGYPYIGSFLIGASGSTILTLLKIHYTYGNYLALILYLGVFSLSLWPLLTIPTPSFSRFRRVMRILHYAADVYLFVVGTGLIIAIIIIWYFPQFGYINRTK